MKETAKLISIVVPCYNEQDNLAHLTERLIKQLKNEKIEIIFVDDGSNDQTIQTIKNLKEIYPFVQFISFSRNFGHQSALMAGMHYARGDAIISMDADLQHPPELIQRLLKKWEEGYDIVVTKRENTSNQSFIKKFTSDLFYKIFKMLSGIDIDRGAADFRLVDKKVALVLNGLHETNIFFRGMVCWVGFKKYIVEYSPDKRFAGESKYNLKKMLSLAFSGTISFSSRPLRLSFILFCFFSIFCLFYISYVLWQVYIGNPIKGWASLMIVILLSSSLQFLLIWILSEYVGRIFVETKKRPVYVIKETSITSKD